MPILVTSNCDNDSIKNERASMETPFSLYKSMGSFSDAQEQVSLQLVLRSDRNFMHVLVTCKYKKNHIKTIKKRWR